MEHSKIETRLMSYFEQDERKEHDIIRYAREYTRSV